MNFMFRGYDIRGLYGSEVTDEKFTALGRTLNAFAGREIIAGMDYRPASGKLFNAFCKGFSGTVKSLGIVPTPAASFSSRGWGIVFTASHNPAQYAGAKFVHLQRMASEAELKSLEDGYEKQLKAGGAAGSANAKVIDSPELLAAYIESIPEMGNAIFDLGGGSACAVKQLFGKRLFDVPDPNFEKHSPEPKDETLGELKRATVKEKALGLAFDGDGDRCMVAAGGRVIDGGIMAAWLCENHFKKGDRMVINIDFTDEVKYYLADAGFRVSVCAVGTTNVVHAVLKESAALGAERNGHYYFPKHVPDSDGIYAAALFSQATAKEIQEFAARFKSVLITQAVEGPVNFIRLKEILVQDESLLETSFLDGVYARFEDFTLLIRESKTEPKVRINSEGKNRENALKGMEKAKEMLAKCRA
jgi:phosphomannomutase